MPCVVEGRAEERHDHVADELVERALVREHEVHHPGEVLVEHPDDLFGLPALGDRRKAADVREEHGHLAARAAEPCAARVGHQLVVDVLRDVLAEQPLHLPLLAAFDEVLIGDASKKSQRHREDRLRQIQPVAACEQPHRCPREGRSRDPGEDSGPPRGQNGRGHTDKERGAHNRRQTGAVSSRPHEPVRQHIVRHGGVHLDTRHPTTGERRLEHVEQPRSRDADEDDLVPEDGGVNLWRRAARNLLL